MSTAWHGGKGSAPRKNNDQKAYENGYERIFGKRNRSNPQGDPHIGTTEPNAEGTDTHSDVSKT